MKRISFFMFCLLAIASAAFAQQKNPPVGGMAAPIEEPNPIKEARRAVMRDSIVRQYTAEEIEQFRKAIDGYEKAQAGAYAESAKVIRRRILIGLASDAPVPEVRANAESTISIAFTDSMGSPWNVLDSFFPGFVTGKSHKNIITLLPKSGEQNNSTTRFARASFTVLLEGVNTPIVIGLSYGFSNTVDGVVEAQVQARNPAAAINAVQGGSSVDSDDAFPLFIDGEPPREAIKIKTSLKGVDAWTYLSRLYVRTTLSLHSPAFRLFGTSASGVSVYRFDQMPSIINAITDGVILAVAIGE